VLSIPVYGFTLTGTTTGGFTVGGDTSGGVITSEGVIMVGF
jgi:hypothetical protein